MNIFGVGTWEMLVIIVGALIIFGPGKLPEVMGQAGRMVRDFRRMTADLTGEFEKAVGDPNEIKRALTGEIDSVKSQVSGTASTVKRDLNQVSTSVGRTVSGATKSGTGTTKSGWTTTKSGTATKSAAGAASASAKKTTSTSTSSANKSTTVANAVVSPAATKADPLADVFLFDSDSVPAAAPTAKLPAEGKPGANGAAKSATPARPITGQVGIADGDPLARARQRRQSAGYGAGRRT